MFRFFENGFLRLKHFGKNQKRSNRGHKKRIAQRRLRIFEGLEERTLLAALSVTGVRVPEDVGRASIVVSLSEPSTGEVSVDLSMVDGTAKDGPDYLAYSIHVAYAAGEFGSKRFHVEIVDDSVSEPVEQFSTVLSNAIGADIERGSDDVIIDDNDSSSTAPAITSVASTTFNVGVLGSFTVTATGSPTPTLNESGALPDGVTFDADANTLTGTPMAGTTGNYDISFTAHNGVGSDAVQNFTLTINQSDQAPAITSANSTTFYVGAPSSFIVTASGFPAASFSETGDLPSGVTLNSTTGVLGGTPANGTAATYPITITASNGVAPDAAQNFTLSVAPAITVVPTIAILNTRIVEGDDGTTDVLITVQLSASSDQEVRVDYQTADGTAIAGSDYIAVNGTLVFDSGTTTKMIGVPIHGDTAAERNEALLVTLSNSRNAVIVDGEGRVVVQDDDMSPNQDFVSNIYGALLQRPVEPTGSALWTGLLDRGLSRTDFVLTIQGSIEFRTRQVTRLYRNLLEREPDPTGFDFYVQAMMAGKTLDEVKASLLGSDEYFQSRGGGTNGGFLAAVYQDELRRPIEQAGLNDWNSQLSRGVSREELALMILRSVEANEIAVKESYLRYLGRPADLAGLDAFKNVMLQGISIEGVDAHIVSSPEYSFGERLWGEMNDDFVADVPAIMEHIGWTTASILQTKWFSGAANQKLPTDPDTGKDTLASDDRGTNAPLSIDTTTVTMSWLSGFPRFQEAFDKLFESGNSFNPFFPSKYYYASPKALAGLKDRLLKEFQKPQNLGVTTIPFGDLAKTGLALHSQQTNFSPISSLVDADDLHGSLGDFALYAVPTGTATLTPNGMHIRVSAVGVYALDSYDFNAKQSDFSLDHGLGSWKVPDGFVLWLPESAAHALGYTPVSDKDYRDYRTANERGADFLIFSDLRIRQVADEFDV